MFSELSFFNSLLFNRSNNKKVGNNFNEKKDDTDKIKNDNVSNVKNIFKNHFPINKYNPHDTPIKMNKDPHSIL